VVLAAGTPSATTTTYAYDEQGNRTTQTDAEGRSTRFVFDRMGRETSRTLPLGQECDFMPVPVCVCVCLSRFVR
jgi:YD repeat-containing protein